jgi:hypothetical protein
VTVGEVLNEMSLDLLNVVFKVGWVLVVTPANTELDVDDFLHGRHLFYSDGLFIFDISIRYL